MLLMSDFKKQLSELLTIEVKEIFPEAELINEEMTEHGFYCDYALSQPLNPDNFGMIADNLKQRKACCFYELKSFSGVYENGDAKNRTLQRIYVTAVETKEKYDEYKNSEDMAALRDHKALGAQLKLFSSSSDIGQGLILWHPKGAMLRYLLEQFGQSAHILNDYQWVYSPHIGRAELWKTSGHLDFYKDSMYNPIKIDDEEYYLKPMNCPFHIDIYKSEIRSYKELPMRYAEYGTVYRYELSGALNGLTRVRGFTQDDAHIFCTAEQVETEVLNALRFSLYILRSFGFESFHAYISTKPEKKFIGDDEDWNRATEVLKKAVISAGLDYKIDEGGGAFYGPKIDLKLTDSIGREWQCSTIQFDFNLPARFEMSYIGSDGRKHTPLMVHRALFGSFERFIALLIEHYGGDFPFWFSPLQFGVVPVKPDNANYCVELVKALKRLGFRARLDGDNDNMRNKIKRFELEKVSYILVVGDREAQSSTFSVRSRKNGSLGEMDLSRLCDYLKPEIARGVPKYILD